MSKPRTKTVLSPCIFNSTHRMRIFGYSASRLFQYARSYIQFNSLSDRTRDFYVFLEQILYTATHKGRRISRLFYHEGVKIKYFVCFFRMCTFGLRDSILDDTATKFLQKLTPPLLAYYWKRSFENVHSRPLLAINPIYHIKPLFQINTTCQINTICHTKRLHASSVGGSYQYLVSEKVPAVFTKLYSRDYIK
jgi:hypothetical protein